MVDQSAARASRRIAVSVVACLLAAALPVLVVGLAFEESVSQWLARLRSHPGLLLIIAFGLLVSDIFLPIPSSFVCTLCGQSVNWIAASLACGGGMFLGSSIGFQFARTLGQRAGNWFSSPADVGILDAWIERNGVWWLVILRPVPILAEASVLLCGVHRMPWAQFLVASGLSNLIVAGSFVLLGTASASGHWTTVAWATSIAIPILLTFLIRLWMK